MSTTQPVRDLNDLKKLRNYYKEIEPHPRNYALLCMGFNTALRISDLLCLTWADVYDFQKQRLLTHLQIIEEKTDKRNCIYLNDSVREALFWLKGTLPSICGEQYLFSSTQQNHPIHRTQAYRIIRHACDQLELDKHISCHSMRKTFGYQAWKSGVQPALLMHIYNHSSFQITKTYLGINQDDQDSVFCQIRL